MSSSITNSSFNLIKIHFQSYFDPDINFEEKNNQSELKQSDISRNKLIQAALKIENLQYIQKRRSYSLKNNDNIDEK